MLGPAERRLIDLETDYVSPRRTAEASEGCRTAEASEGCRTAEGGTKDVSPRRTAEGLKDVEPLKHLRAAGPKMNPLALTRGNTYNVFPRLC